MILSVLRRGKLSGKISEILIEKSNFDFMNLMHCNHCFFFQTVTIVILDTRRKEFLKKYEHKYASKSKIEINLKEMLFETNYRFCRYLFIFAGGGVG